MPDMDISPNEFLLNNREELLFLTLVDTMEKWVEEIYDVEGGILRSEQLSSSMARAAYACVQASEDAVELTNEVNQADDENQILF